MSGAKPRVFRCETTKSRHHASRFPRRNPGTVEVALPGLQEVLLAIQYPRDSDVTSKSHPAFGPHSSIFPKVGLESCAAEDSCSISDLEVGRGSSVAWGAGFRLRGSGPRLGGRAEEAAWTCRAERAGTGEVAGQGRGLGVWDCEGFFGTLRAARVYTGAGR